MGGMQVMRTGVAAAVVIAVSLVAAGCGSDDSSGDSTAAKTPAGFKRIKTDDFSLAVPTAWTSDTGKADGGGKFIEVRSPGADINRPQVRVASSRDYDSRLDNAVKLAEGEIPVRRPGAQRVVARDVPVAGAADARRLEWTVPAGGGLSPARIVTVLALSQDRTLVNLSMGVAQDQVVAARVDDVISSLDLGAK